MPLRSFVSAGPRVWLDALYACALSAVVELRLRFGHLPGLAADLGVPIVFDCQPAAPGRLDQVGLTSREGQRIDVAWRVLRHRPFNGTCLRRALIGGHILRRRNPKLRIGVKSCAGRIEAHAWIEVDSVSLDPDAGDGYGVLQTIDEEPNA